MDETSLSLLARIQQSDDPDSWSRLVDLYTPQMRRWLRDYEVQDADTDDLIQEVLTVVARELPKFEHNQRAGSFRSWLRKTLVNRLRNFWRARQRQPVAKGSSSLFERLNQPRPYEELPMGVKFSIRSVLAIVAVFGVMLAILRPLGTWGVVGAAISATVIGSVIVFTRRLSLAAISLVVVGTVVGAVLGPVCFLLMRYLVVYRSNPGLRGISPEGDILVAICGAICGVICGALITSLIMHTMSPPNDSTT